MTNSADPDQLASKKPTDLDLHCLQRQGISGLMLTQQRLRSVWVFMQSDQSSFSNAQADLNLCCVYMSEGTFSDFVARMT